MSSNRSNQQPFISSQYRIVLKKKGLRTHRVKRSCGHNLGGFRLVRRRQSVKSGLKELRGARAHHNVTPFRDRVSHETMQRPNLLIQVFLHEPNMLALREVAHPLVPQDDGDAGGAVPEPEILEHGGIAVVEVNDASGNHLSTIYTSEALMALTSLGVF